MASLKLYNVHVGEYPDGWCHVLWAYSKCEALSMIWNQFKDDIDEKSEYSVSDCFLDWEKWPEAKQLRQTRQEGEIVTNIGKDNFDRICRRVGMCSVDFDDQPCESCGLYSVGIEEFIPCEDCGQCSECGCGYDEESEEQS